MLHSLSIWLVAAAFVGAGLVNAAGRPAVKGDFVRWGYPAWWCHLTGGLEILVAALVAFPDSRAAGLVLGAAIMAAAALTVVRHRAFAHLAPIGAIAVLLALAALPVGPAP